MNNVQATASFLRRHSLQLATAESCTAGLIASKVAEVPGCGSVLTCAVVAYAPDVKQYVLGVPREVIERHGLTSEAVSLEMARGVLRLGKARLAIANTGVADRQIEDGPPAGTQCFAWVFRLQDGMAAFTATKQFRGERNEVRDAAAEWALARVPHYYECARREIAAGKTGGVVAA